MHRTAFSVDQEIMQQAISYNEEVWFDVTDEKHVMYYYSFSSPLILGVPKFRDRSLNTYTAYRCISSIATT